MTYTLSGRTGVGSTANIVQFPLRLAHALTAHKTQGQTYKMPMTVTVDLRDVFEAAQAYVMIGRPEKLQQLFIVEELDQSKLYSNNRVREEYEKMNSRSINQNPSNWDKKESGSVKICSLNCARLKPHFEDIKADHTLKKSDIIHLQETWLEENEDQVDQMNLPNYQVNNIKVGKGKGITTYYSKTFHHVSDVVNPNYQITKYESNHVVSINIYRSAGGSTSEILDAIERLENKEKANIITGDMNICAQRERKGLFIKTLTEQGFTLLTKKATHIKGRQIDHIYTKNAEATLNRYTPYYSDHDALCVAVEKVITYLKLFK